MKEVLLFGTQESKGRKIADPPIEVSAIGPQESFVEDIELNTALLRRRMKTSKMKMVRFVKGRITKNNIMIAYIEGIVKASWSTSWKNASEESTQTDHRYGAFTKVYRG